MQANAHDILQRLGLLDLLHEDIATGFLYHGNCGWCIDNKNTTDIIAMARGTEDWIPNMGFWDGVCVECSDEWASLWPCDDDT